MALTTTAMNRLSIMKGAIRMKGRKDNQASGNCSITGGTMPTELFGEAFPEWFGSLGASLYTLFQVMTLESWSMGIVRPVMEKFPLAWMYFLPFILIATFMMLNLFVAVVVNAMQATHDQEALLAPPSTTEQLLLDELKALRAEVAALRQPRA